MAEKINERQIESVIDQIDNKILGIIATEWERQSMFTLYIPSLLDRPLDRFDIRNTRKLCALLGARAAFESMLVGRGPVIPSCTEGVEGIQLVV